MPPLLQTIHVVWVNSAEHKRDCADQDHGHAKCVAAADPLTQQQKCEDGSEDQAQLVNGQDDADGAFLQSAKEAEP
jgi:hypothetical protein